MEFAKLDCSGGQNNLDRQNKDNGVLLVNCAYHTNGRGRNNHTIV